MIPTDLWRVGIVKAPMTAIIDAGSLDGLEIKWLPAEGPLRFVADPFGLWRDGLLHIFVETYDYRSQHGLIEVLILDEKLDLLTRGSVLRELWHLSYPFVFEADGEIWLLPEAWRSGRLTLYRATEFPWCWEVEERFTFPEAAIDATPVRTPDGWWMFYTPPGPKSWRQSALKLARADSLLGKWKGCGDAPILLDRAGARMGGTPVWRDGMLCLPTQDCRRAYGRAITIRKTGDPAKPPLHVFTAAHIEAPPSFRPYTDGLHTLSEAGRVTLIDAKRTVRSFHHLGIKIARALSP